MGCFIFFVGIGIGSTIAAFCGNHPYAIIFGGIVGGIGGIILAFYIESKIAEKQHKEDHQRSNELAEQGKVCPNCGSKIREIRSEYYGLDYSCVSCSWNTFKIK